MDANIADYPVSVSTNTGKETSGDVKVQTWTQRERFTRAAKFWGGAWGMMILSAFLPIAHFVLVPAFFLAGPIAGFIVYRQESVVLGGQSTCPQCGQPLPLVRGPNKWPLEDMCTHCQTHVVVKKRENSPG